MLKLYKKNETNTQYWEAWEREGSVVIHTGVLGDEGEVEQIELADGEDINEIIAAESLDVLSEGYAEVSSDDHGHLILQYKMKGPWAEESAVEKRHAVEDMIDQCLGWTGNGHCDGGDIGSGTVNIFSFVVDPAIAKKTILALLQEEKLLDGATLALQNDESYEVLWPEKHNGEFSII